jgi:hypothetical protein
MALQMIRLKLILPVLLLNLLVGNPAVSKEIKALEECEERLNSGLKFPSTYKRLDYAITSRQCYVYTNLDGWGVITTDDDLNSPVVPSKSIYLRSLGINGKCSDYSNISPKRKYLSYIVRVEYSAKIESNQTRLGVFECIVNYRRKKDNSILDAIIGNNLSFGTIYYRFRY